MPIEGNTILAAQGGFEPQRTNNWLVQINGSTLPGLSASDFYLALKTFPFPVESNPVQRIRWYNESRTYAGSLADFGDLNMQVHDYLDRATAQILYNWRRLIWNPGNLTIGLAANYKMTGMLYLGPPNAVSVADIMGHSRTWYLQGIWPTNLDMGSFGGERPNLLHPSGRPGLSGRRRRNLRSLESGPSGGPERSLGVVAADFVHILDFEAELP
jgi:hypothetical protein